ncbi:site-specific integrase [Ralstonia sp. CHL-2022]|uniref:Site-specific integrase n=1 Tax=Ralstonia mojiangensis TaxID=2953895 RepID=A0AAE3I6N5_9RALS|nr:site-specific integrase [Ralstonia mojiangensis]MCT7318658.1 site-specific integrase [Ralstonia mojiangensis]
MKTHRLPDLEFHNVAYGKLEIRWNLLPLLYSGGAAENARIVSEKINAGTLGQPIRKRLSAITCIHDFICAELESGSSKNTISKLIRVLRQFYIWGDNNNRQLTRKSLEADFLDWATHLRHRSEVSYEIKTITAYDSLKRISHLIENSIGPSSRGNPVSRSSRLITLTGIPLPKRGKRPLNAEEEKTLTSSLFTFGEFLLDLSTALTAAAIRSEDPIGIKFRNGKYIEEETVPRSISRAAWDQDTDTGDREPDANGVRRLRPDCDKNRYPLVNLRISAELLIFIAQTGMNLSQASKLRVGRFSYQSRTDGYQVFRVYKNRRSGEVAFDIYREYRPIFENYLAWRRDLFPSSQSENEYLFPFWQSPKCVSLSPPTFACIKQRCVTLGIRYFGPQALRLWRTNWLLKNSRDTALVAELGQHSEKTLTGTYERPSLRTIFLEVSRFHAAWEPVLLASGPGVCVHPEPKPLADTPSDAPQPDCISPAGCLFCIHHRDIKSAEHVWSLASYRHLKSLELAAYGDGHQAGKPNPAATTVSIISRKLEEFGRIGPSQSGWVDEAISRVAEGYFHPRWDGFIQLMETSHGT